MSAVENPPQPEVARLVDGCRKAGIRVIIVTGGYGLTAEASARRAGIVTAPRVQIVSGAELAEMKKGTLGLVIAPGEEVLFAQLDTAQKRMIVEALQDRGEIVAFLGDSISDAPALKQADIGVALSASGTTVALAAADIVLDASHPGGLLLAIEEGRAIFSNIQKFATYLFTHNVAEAFVIVISVLFQLPLPLTVLQVLAIDLGTELLPAVALSTEPPEPGILDQPPRARSRPLLEKAVLWRVFAWLGLIQGLMALGAYLLGHWSGGWRPGMAFDEDGIVYMQATTLTYAAIVLAQAGNVFACRTWLLPVTRMGIFTNRVLVAGVIVSTLAMLAMIYVEPLAQIFGFVAPTPWQWMVVATFAPLMFVAHEAAKWWARRQSGRNE
ncbi:MAG TPA: HAD-IC family P-type ATPase [Roseiflexaceae bacterium]|nr:HAD-IC family P-type ATPase [Roseiflexaceae bacterium]